VNLHFIVLCVTFCCRECHQRSVGNTGVSKGTEVSAAVVMVFPQDPGNTHPHDCHGASKDASII
jgi:hypothetical protein